MPLPMFQKSLVSDSPTIKNVIAIAAGKGGVGKSSITVNLAYALKYLGYTVGVLDADIYGPSIRKMLPENEMPVQKGERILPAHSFGISVISMAYFRRDHEAAVVRAPIANGLISQFISNVDWGVLDFLLIDFPPGTGDIQLTLAQKAHLTGALMVTTPQEVALLDVRKAMNMFAQVNIPILGIVENMSYYLHPSTQEKTYIFGQGGGERLGRESGVPLLGTVPLDPLLCKNGDSGDPLIKSEESISLPIVQSFLTLGKNLIQQLDIEKNTTGSYLSDFELIWKEM